MPPPLGPIARRVVAKLAPHLGKLQQGLGRTLARVVRRGPKKLAGASKLKDEAAHAAESFRDKLFVPDVPAAPELVLEAPPVAEALFTAFDVLLLVGALVVLGLVAWRNWRSDAATVKSATPRASRTVTPEDKRGPTEPRTVPGRFAAVLRGPLSPGFASPQSFEERRSRRPERPKPRSPRGAPGTAVSPPKPGRAVSPAKPPRPAPSREARTAFVYYGLEQLGSRPSTRPGRCGRSGRRARAAGRPWAPRRRRPTPTRPAPTRGATSPRPRPTSPRCSCRRGRGKQN